LDKKINLELLDNIQFIYELALAKLELQSFGESLIIKNGFREFGLKLKNDYTKIDLKKRLAYFKAVDGENTDYYELQKYNQTKSVNQYLTHWIYPYKGKFHPQMIRALINIIGLGKGQTLLDPFVGSGTAILEAQLLGINSIGIDISSLCVLISKVKTQSLDKIDIIKKYRNNYIHQGDLFSSRIKRKVQEEEVNNFYKIAEMIAHSDQKRRGKNFESSYYQNIDKMLLSLEDFKKAKDKLKIVLGETKVLQEDARNLKIKSNSIDGIITSPPYSIALNYVSNDSHSLQALGYDLNKIKEDFIGVRGTGFEKFDLYENDMQKAYSEMYRVLKKNSYCVVIIGNVTYDGQEVDTTQQVIDFCGKLGFKTIKKIDKIIFGLYNVMQKEYILIFQKG